MNRLDELENAIKNAEENITNLRNELEELKKNSESVIPGNAEDIPKKYDFDDYKKMSGCWHRVWLVNEEGELTHAEMDKEGIKGNMIFPTKEFAEMFREKAQLIADCLLFKWLYDREYVPDWENDSYKYGVCVRNGNFDVDSVHFADFNAIYFSSEEIAQKCAEWLGYRREKGMKEE